MGGGVVQQYHVNEKKIYHSTWLEVPIDAFRNTNPLLLEVKETKILQNVYRLSEEEKTISYLPGEESGDSDSDWKTENSVLLTYLVTQSSL